MLILEQLYLMVLPSGTQPLISECYGRGDRKDAERLYRMSAATAVALLQ